MMVLVFVCSDMVENVVVIFIMLFCVWMQFFGSFVVLLVQLSVVIVLSEVGGRGIGVVCVNVGNKLIVLLQVIGGLVSIVGSGSVGFVGSMFV